MAVSMCMAYLLPLTPFGHRASNPGRISDLFTEMGLCTSSAKVGAGRGFGASEGEIMGLFQRPIPGQDRAAAKALSMLQLTLAEIKSMLSVFWKIDKDNSGSIDLEEFYGSFHLEPTPFADRVFSLMDEDVSMHVIFFWFFLSANLYYLSR